MSGHAPVVVEADGGSRGNPGPAAYGAVLKAADGSVLAERAERIGVASNNVAEYRGLLAGLELHREHAPDAALEVRMDSKLVVEQMSGRWRIKHPDMRELAGRARDLAPEGTTYTWIPRADNAHADRLVNEALDGKRRPAPKPASRSEEVPTTLLLVRHGLTDHTVKRLLSGGLGGSDPGLNDEGRAQVRATAHWLAPLADGFDALVTSPVRRTRESAEILGERLGLDVEVEPGLAEMEFGTWDGLTFEQVREQYPDEVTAWLGDLDHAPGGGESLRAVERRVLEGRDRLLARYAGRTVVVVSHVTPIKTLVADALRAPLESAYRMELSPASVTVLSHHPASPEGRPEMTVLRLFNARPTDVPFVDR